MDKKQIAIITASDVLERRKENGISVTFGFIFDSGFDGEKIVQELWSKWGYLSKKRGQWVLSYGNANGGFGGGMGTVKNGFDADRVKDTPEMVVLMKKEHVNDFKVAFESFFNVFQFDFNGDLKTG